MLVSARRSIFQLCGLIAALFLLSGLADGALGASEIQGRVTNRTRAAAAAGDKVILLRLEKGMQEESRTKTDAEGDFRVAVQQPEKEYLVRVVHQGVNYDQRAAAGTMLLMDVFDAAQKVTGIRGTIEILRAGTIGPTGTVLHVSDMYEIENDSNPPLTKAGARTFEVYLPPNAKIVSVLAAGPGRIGVMIPAQSVKGEPGHFAVNFPLRPGANKFAFNYDVPYDGHAVFQTRREFGVQQLAVMLPLEMKFTSHSTSFALLAAGNPKYQVEATKELHAGAGPAFELSGSGELPVLQARASKSGAAEVAPSPVIPPAKIPAPLNAAGKPQKHIQMSSEALVLPGVATVLLAIVLTVNWQRSARRKRRAKTLPRQAHKAEPSFVLLDALRHELSRLDNDRSRGTISESDYASTKEALERSWQRLVAKHANRPAH
jgi:hypothetical protein